MSELRPAAGGYQQTGWQSWLPGFAAYLLLVAGYAVSFDFNFGDTLDTVRWIRAGEIANLVEFRHLIQRALPYWAWQGADSLGIQVPLLVWFSLLDFLSAAAAVVLFYRLLGLILPSRTIQFLGAFLLATTHCFWEFTGSGRLYSTSLLLVFGAYYLALASPRLAGARRWLATAAAAVLVCVACLFWLVHIFNAVGVGLLFLLMPEQGPVGRRVRLATLFAVTGTLAALAIGASSLSYIGVSPTPTAVQAWANHRTMPPTKLDWTSPMKAAFGQTHGIMALPGLPFMVNGLLRQDPELLRVGSLPWQLGKFFFISALLLLVYVYPWLLLKRVDAGRRALILVLYVPLLINLYFALSWLGTDRQRFLPSIVSIIVLGLLSGEDLAKRLGRPRLVASLAAACLLLIAGVNLYEVQLSWQRKYVVVDGQFGSLPRPLQPSDLLVDFGRDIDYQAAIQYLTGAPYLTLSNDPTYYDWDRPDWETQFQLVVKKVSDRGGRVFVLDRLAEGFQPTQAAWSVKQHPRPTIQQFAAYLRRHWCVTPAFEAGDFQYYRLSPQEAGCPPDALRTGTEGPS